MTKKVPTLTQQINKLVERKLAINNNKQTANATMQSFQKEVDEAQWAFDELVCERMAHPTNENILKVEDARSAKNIIVLNYENAKNDLQSIPGTLKKLDSEIRALTSEKKNLEMGVIKTKLPDLDELKQKAREAIAKLSTAWCMTATRNTNYMGVREVAKQLDKDNSVSILLINKYGELTEQMGFEKL